MVFKFDAPIPGQSWQHEPRTMAWDRPPQFADVNQGLIYLFKKLRQPQMTKSILNLIDTGIPVDFIAQQLLMTGQRQGTFGTPALIPMVGPLIVMLIRMAETAGLTPVTSNQKTKNVDFDPADLQAAQSRVQNNTAQKAQDANDKSVKDLTQKGIMDKQGFMQFRPVAKKNGLI